MFYGALSYIANSKKEAKARGDKFYHPGRNCRQWHYSVFYAKAQRCKECARIKVCAARHKHPKYAESQREACRRNYIRSYHGGDGNSKSKILKANKIWREENRSWHNEYAKVWRRKKINEGDGKVIAAEALRNIIGRSVKAGYVKNHSTKDILGYSPADLRDHMESMFEEGMSWSNHGAWHIDHIRPISSFPNDTDPKEVHALSNLQPLWAKENLEKSDKWQ